MFNSELTFAICPSAVSPSRKIKFPKQIEERINAKKYQNYKARRDILVQPLTSINTKQGCLCPETQVSSVRPNPALNWPKCT